MRILKGNDEQAVELKANAMCRRRVGSRTRTEEEEEFEDEEIETTAGSLLLLPM